MLDQLCRPTKKVVLVDCRNIASGADELSQHSYYINSRAVSQDIAAVMLGLEPDMLGRAFHCEGRQFAVRGLNVRARSKPIIAEELATGRRYKFATAAVKAGMTP